MENMMPGGSDLQGLMRVNQHQNPSGLEPAQGLMGSPLMQEVVPLNIGQSHKCDHNKGEKGKTSAIDKDEQCFNGEAMDGQSNPSKGKKVPPQWDRVKWNNSMIKLMITAVSYLSEECLNLVEQSNWKLVSKVMAERGYFVSSKQCEYKFNDLDKRYNQLIEILGKGTSCHVVENPALLDMMDHLSKNTKELVRKILSSKHLFYQELCSFHNNNRLHLPHDPALQQSVQLAFRSRDDHNTEFSRHLHDGAYSDDAENYGDGNKEAYALSRDPSKRMKQGLDYGQDFIKGFQMQSQNPCADMLTAFPECQDAALLQKRWLKSQTLQLEEQTLQIESEMLDLKKQRFKLQRSCKRKDRELEKLKQENDKMKLENERIAFELKRMEMSNSSKKN